MHLNFFLGKLKKMCVCVGRAGGEVELLLAPVLPPALLPTSGHQKPRTLISLQDISALV